MVICKNYIYLFKWKPNHGNPFGLGNLNKLRALNLSYNRGDNVHTC